MPRLTEAERELRANLAALKAAQVAARKAQAESERPLRLARAPLSRAVTGHLSRVKKYAAKLARAIHDNVFSGGLSAHRVAITEAALRLTEEGFKAALVTLQTFDLMHGIDGADYPSLTVIDRAGIEAQARADREDSLQAIRKRYAPRPQRPSATPTTNLRFTPFTDIDDENG